MIKQFRECVERWGLSEGLTEKGKSKLLKLIDADASANEVGWTFICILIECATRESMQEEAIEFALQNDDFRLIHGPSEE